MKRLLLKRLLPRLSSMAALAGVVLSGSVSAARADTGDQLYAVESGGALYIAPDVQAPAVFPLDLGRELIEMERRGEWIQVRDSLTGLIGWAIPDFLGDEMPADAQALTTQDRKAEFAAFKERFDGLNQSISEVTGHSSFDRAEHMGGGAVRIFANDGWYGSRRREQQAYRIFSMWKIANAGQPVFLSFADDQGKERFIVLDGPNRPRLLTSNAE